MKKLAALFIAVLFVLALVACGDHDHHERVFPRILEILSDPTLDGDITLDLTSNTITPPTFAANTGDVLAGIDVSPITRASVSETRGFLIFPLGALPPNASIQFASIIVFINNVFFATTSTAPIPFLLDSIDTILFPPPIVSTDFDSPFRISKSLSFFGRDAGKFVEIDVTSLLADAQARLLSQFEVRFVFDQVRFQNDPTTTRGLIEIDDRATNASRAPLLHVEFF